MLYDDLVTLGESKTWFNYTNGIDSDPTSRSRPEYPLRSNWNDLVCDEFRMLNMKWFKFKTSCATRSSLAGTAKALSKFKLFIAFDGKHRRKRLRSMYDYARHCSNGTITRHMHDIFLYFLESIRLKAERATGRNVQVWNENTEVPALHFKFRIL